MTERTSLQSNSDAPDSDSNTSAGDIRERTERLQRKVGDLSKTFDHIEKTLAEAADDSEERGSEK
jgi:hypothetical protein